jgi:UDP-glucose 4-epimerase
MPKILITGGSGYVGSNLAYSLSEIGYEVVITDFPELFPEFLVKNTSIDFQAIDIRSQNQTLEIISDIDLVIHLAAFKSVTKSSLDPEGYFENNVNGTINIAQALIANKIVPIIFASSAAVYSQNIVGSIFEYSPTEPKSIYGQSKLLSENYLRNVANAKQINAIVLRFFNIGGAIKHELADRSTENILSILFNKSYKKESFKIYGDTHGTFDGTCVRDYVHISDIVSAIVASIEKLLKMNDTGNYDVYNVGSGYGASVLQVLRTFEKISNTKVSTEILDSREGESSESIASIVKIQEQLNWNPTYSLEEIIESSWKAWLHQT